MSGSSRRSYTLEISGESYELTEAALTGVLFDIVTTLVFEKRAHRVTYVLKGSDLELARSGSAEMSPLTINLYRYLKEQRCPVSLGTGLEGESESFRLNSVIDALVAVAFFRKAGDFVPHFIVDDDLGNELLRVIDRGERVRLTVEDAEVRSQLTRLVSAADED